MILQILCDLLWERGHLGKVVAYTYGTKSICIMTVSNLLSTNVVAVSVIGIDTNTEQADYT